MKKTKYFLCLFMLSVLLFTACDGNAHSSTPDSDDSTAPGVSAQLPSYVSDAYLQSDVISKQASYLVNAPGIIIFSTYAPTKLAYINKANSTPYYFCCDPLCAHQSAGCISNAFCLVENTLYHNGAIYASKPEFERGMYGSSIYKLELGATKAELIYKGNGSDILNMYACDNYLFLRMASQDEGFDIIRYDLSNKKEKKMEAPKYKSFQTISISGEYIYVLFNDDPAYYLTDSDFSQFVKIECLNNSTYWRYINRNYVFGQSQYLDGKEYLYSNGTGMPVAITMTDINANTTVELITNNGAPIALLGVSDHFVYYRRMYYDEVSTSYLQHQSLMAYDLKTGEEKTVTDEINIKISTVYEYDGIPYCLCENERIIAIIPGEGGGTDIVEYNLEN